MLHGIRMVTANPPPKERVQFFRKMAAAAERAATIAKPKVAESYRKMAKHWRALAEGVEGSHSPGAGENEKARSKGRKSRRR